MIDFKNVSKIFKSEILTQPFVALDDVTFKVPEGSMVGFLGANGAGKTTSLKIIMDFIRPTSGEVSFSGLGDHRQNIFKQIGFLPERPYFYQNLTGEEFLEFMGALSEIKRSELRDRIKKWAPRFKIDHALKRPLRTYSKGMLQRTGFMSTILHGPKLIILDEPLSGLDPIGRKELKDVIVEVHREGKTVFFSSHIVPDIEEICDRVIFLKEGKLVYDGKVENLLKSQSGANFVIKFRCENEKVFKTPYYDRQNFPEGLEVVTLSEQNKNMFLEELVSIGGDVKGVEQLRPTLEEIFYNIKSPHL